MHHPFVILATDDGAKDECSKAHLPNAHLAHLDWHTLNPTPQGTDM